MSHNDDDYELHDEDFLESEKRLIQDKYEKAFQTIQQQVNNQVDEIKACDTQEQDLLIARLCCEDVKNSVIL